MGDEARALKHDKTGVTFGMIHYSTPTLATKT